MIRLALFACILLSVAFLALASFIADADMRRCEVSRSFDACANLLLR